MAKKVATTGYRKDGGHGNVVQNGAPENNMMSMYYDQLNKSGGFDERGNPTKTGKQGEAVTGKVTGDPTKGAGLHRNETYQVNSKSPSSKISKEVRKPHKVKNTKE